MRSLAAKTARRVGEFGFPQGAEALVTFDCFWRATQRVPRVVP